MEPSVFTKIIRGEIPCHKVYEDDRVLAFLDINPVTEGHTLVITKQQIDQIWDVDDDLYQHLMTVAKKVARKQREELRPPRVAMAVEGFAVPHVHVHVFPIKEPLEESMAHKLGEQPDEALAAMAKRLAIR